ncbi:hypothetical protein KILIM_034_00320 [Kineosphaera limosa NBRC 100340]|uniref:Uncharacterized protein n=1 Tax=Kineosphaera limosa NBRC 100340 TaxID=1184609 RepID=K6VJA3_9MICO|nr:hypothetical protein KILIM_034_00320 [Kineosphaera limosa NBRC 100340]
MSTITVPLVAQAPHSTLKSRTFLTKFYGSQAVSLRVALSWSMSSTVLGARSSWTIDAWGLTGVSAAERWLSRPPARGVALPTTPQHCPPHDPQGLELHSSQHAQLPCDENQHAPP